MGIKENSKKQFTFIDLFCGIGGTRLGFERNGGQCIFSSDWDKHSQITYAANFEETPLGDITKINSEDIPDHDVLIAGFPCQPFSIAGVSKKNSMGRVHGFEDKTQGTLFFDVARIIRDKKPRAFLLENVKNLFRHDGGKTFEIIKSSLEELGYKVFFKIIDARFFVPQHRERIYIVGFRDEDVDFEYPEVPSAGPCLGTILEESADPKYVLSDKLWNYLQAYKKKHEKKGNGFGYSLVTPRDTTRTLSARYHKDGSEILIFMGKNKNPRRLTPRECARLMGFPEDYKIVVSDTQAYRQFGNSVVVPVVESVAKKIIENL